MSSKSFGVIVGRFQTPYLHEGHKALIDYAFKKCDTLIVYIGNTIVKGSEKDPMDYATRRLMLSSYLLDNYEERTFFVYPLQDIPISDKNWVRALDMSISNATLHVSNVTLFGGRDSFLDVYRKNNGRYKTDDFVDVAEFSATQIRKETAQFPVPSEDFRKGCVYAALNKYPVVFSTVDVCVYDPTTKKILFGEKRGCDKLFMPGGFVDVSDPSFASAAVRELKEETGLNVHYLHLKFVGSTKMNDYRFRGREDMGVMTNLFLYVCPTTPSVKAGDDLISLKWVSEDDLEKYVDPIHIPLVREAMKSLISSPF